MEPGGEFAVVESRTVVRHRRAAAVVRDFFHFEPPGEVPEIEIRADHAGGQGKRGGQEQIAVVHGSVELGWKGWARGVVPIFHLLSGAFDEDIDLLADVIAAGQPVGEGSSDLEDAGVDALGVEPVSETLGMT